MHKILKIEESGMIEIKSTNNFQKEVGGWIDVIEITPNIDLIVNDEFLLNNSKPILILNENLIVHGDCFFVGRYFEESISLTEENIKYLLSHLVRIKLLGQELYYLKR